jgi:hypothetical protein
MYRGSNASGKERKFEAKATRENIMAAALGVRLGLYDCSRVLIVEVPSRSKISSIAEAMPLAVIAVADRVAPFSAQPVKFGAGFSMVQRQLW